MFPLHCVLSSEWGVRSAEFLIPNSELRIYLTLICCRALTSNSEMSSLKIRASRSTAPKKPGVSTAFSSSDRSFSTINEIAPSLRWACFDLCGEGVKSGFTLPDWRKQTGGQERLRGPCSSGGRYDSAHRMCGRPRTCRSRNRFQVTSLTPKKPAFPGSLSGVPRKSRSKAASQTRSETCTTWRFSMAAKWFIRRAPVPS